MDAFVHGLTKEMALVDDSGLEFDTIYLGGGTPSVLKPHHVEKIMEHVSHRFDVIDGPEITIEANPGAISPGLLDAWLSFGVNRVNLGIQSFDDRRLDFLGRLHSAKEARQAIHMVRQAGLRNLGLDLMYGLPGQRPQDWLGDLKEATRFVPEHLSCYMLSYEKGTLLDQWREDGRVVPLKENLVRELFDLTVRFLSEKGYEQYEISNFSSAKAYRSRHNQKYWDHSPYLGLGPSAHSFRASRRSWNHADLGIYITELEQGRLPVEGFEVLSLRQCMLETIYLGLRTSEGVRLDRFKRHYHVDFLQYFAPAIEELRKRGCSGLIDCSTERCVLTMEGRAFADTVASVFADYITE